MLFRSIQRRLADKVTEQVRPALFRYYAVIGSIVIAVLGFVGWDYKAEIKTAVMNDIGQELKEKRNEIEESVIRTDVLAKKATKTIEDVDTKLPKLQAKVDEIDENNRKVDNANTNFLYNYNYLSGDLYQTSNALKTQVAVIQKYLKENTKYLKSNIEKDPNFKDIGKAITQKQNEDKIKTTVYFQFAGGSRDKAKRLSEKLKAKGYIVPGEQRIGDAAGKSEVRFFYTADKEKAKELANYLNINNSDSGVGYRKPVNLVNFTDYNKPKPDQGTIELWLEIN